MSSKEYTGWMAYSQLEPIGYDVLYLVGGIIVSNIVNLFIKKEDKKMNPADYVPNFYPEAKDVEDSQEELMAGWERMKAWARSANKGKDTK